MESDRGWPDSGRKKLPGQFLPEIHRILPHSVEAEQGVLGSMLISRDAVAECEMKIDPGYFYVPAHQVIYSELVARWHKSAPNDLITFTQHLRDKNLLEAVGGAALITSIFTFVPTAANVTYYLEIVRDKYILRKIIEASTESARIGFEEQDDANRILAEAQERICKIDIEKSFSRQRETREIVDEMLADLDSPEKALGLSTGFSSLDDVIGGMVEGDNIVIAGRISGGKSAFAQAIANSLAVTRNIPTAIFTFEMSDKQTIRRIAQIRSETSARSIAKGEAEMFTVDAFAKAAQEIAGSPLRVISERLDVAGIKARCMQLKPRVVIVDYLQIIPEKQQKGEGRTERFDRMSAEMKQIAMNCNLTMVTLSQLNDKDTTYGSRMVTGDADILIVIDGDETEDEKKEVEQKNIVIAKQRDGARRTIPFNFVKAITKFRPQKKN